MSKKDGGYEKEKLNQRVVVLMSDDDTKAVDNWGIPAGMPSRTAAVRYLLKQGLGAVIAKESQR
jgi:hypothetical protein